jgi:hypothetical protein
VNRRGWEEKGLEGRLQNIGKEESTEGLQNAQAGEAGAREAQTEEGTKEMPGKTASEEALQNAQAYRAIHPLATSAFDLWHQQNPEGTAQDYENMMAKPLSTDQATSMNSVWNAMASKYGLPQNQFKEGMPAADANALSASLNNVVSRGQGAQNINIHEQQASEKVPMLEPDGKGGFTLQYVQPGQTVTPGSVTPTQQGAATEAAAKSAVGANAAINYANTYLSGGKFTGAGDEALQDQYFEMAKPSSGFRMNQSQIDQLHSMTSWMGSAEGAAYHAATGTWFNPEQRQQIVQTMNDLAKSKGIDVTGGQQQRPANVPDGYVLKDGPKGRGWYAPAAK